MLRMIIALASSVSLALLCACGLAANGARPMAATAVATPGTAMVADADATSRSPNQPIAGTDSTRQGLTGESRWNTRRCLTTESVEVCN